MSRMLSPHARQDNPADLYEDEGMRLLVVLASFAAVVGLAVLAHADLSGDDAAFLAALKQAGITYQDPDRAVAVGKQVCSLFDKGRRLRA
jgi:Protein of unknown function (DUF732)